MKVQIPIVGQAYKHRSVDLSNQTCRGWYPEINPETRSIYSLQPFPGFRELCDTNGADGGLYEFRDTLYKVSGTTLYSVTASGLSTSIGTISGTGLCSFSNNYTTLIIARGGNVYTYDGTTLTTASDPDFESPDYTTLLNNQAIYDGEGQNFMVSDAGDLASIDGLNFAAKESRGDPILRPYVFNDMLYLFGTKSIMQWWNSGVGNPPFDAVQNGTIERGTASARSIANNGQYLYFLGNDYIVYRLIGTQVEPVSTIPIARQFKEWGGEAIGFCYALHGQNFYHLCFEGYGTFVYSEQANAWFELTRQSPAIDLACTSYAEAHGRQYFSRSGKVYYLDDEYYTFGSETILRERISPPYHAGFLDPSLEGHSISMKYLELVVKSVGLLSGQGSSPVVMFSYSDDGGRTWSSERQLNGAPLGRYRWRMRTHSLGKFHERTFRVRVSDPILVSIQSAVADVEIGL